MSGRELENLISAARHGDEGARQQLLELHRAHLRKMVSVRLDPRVGARIDPSDVVQETLFEASRRLDDFLAKRPLPFSAWLRQLPSERLIDTHRRHVMSQKRSVSREREVAMPADASSETLAHY